MPFAIMLFPADMSAPSPQYKAAIQTALRANGGHFAPHGSVRLDDGGQFVVEYDAFRLTRLSLGVCRVVFSAALDTNTYVTNGGSDLAPLKIKGATLKIPAEMGPAVTVATPDVLCAKLEDRWTRWDQDMARLRLAGVIGADDQPLEPPPSPGIEPRLSSDPSGVAAKCETAERKMARDLGWKFVRSIVTRNAQWGVVWRADIAPETDPATWVRDSCWSVPGKHGEDELATSTQPLKMFDQSKNVEPLPAE